MKREERWCLMIGMGAVFFAICIIHWYISLPVIGIYLFIRHLKKKKKKVKSKKKTKSPYPPPQTKYYKISIKYIMKKLQ